MGHRPATAAVTLLVLALSATGCGDDASGASGAPGMSGMDMSSMDEPDATPADELSGADVEVGSGGFRLLDSAPPGSDDVAGRAWQAQDPSGTTVTIRLRGLEPGAAYVSHLHAAACSEDDGGEHFRFDPDGEEVPPNEVHLGFTADDDGTGEATVTNDRRTGDGAPAVVVHPADTPDNRLACADFS